MPIYYEEVVKTIVFDVIETDDDGLIYRLEVLKTHNGFKGKIFRLDTYSLKSSFTKNKPDESIYVLDTHSHLIDLDEKVFDSEQSCIDFVAHALSKNFIKS